MPIQQQRPSNGILSRKDRLKIWRKNKGLEMNVPSDVILPKDMLEILAETGPQSMSELEKLMESCPARFHRFGEEILEISRSEYKEEITKPKER